MSCSFIPASLVVDNSVINEKIQWLYDKTNFKWLFGKNALIKSLTWTVEPIGSLDGFVTSCRYEEVIRIQLSTNQVHVFVDRVEWITENRLFETNAIWRLENFNVDEFCRPYIDEIETIINKA